MVLLSFTLSCLAQFPLDVSQTVLVPMQPGASPEVVGRPALRWNGAEYVLVWRDPRRGSGRHSLFATTLTSPSLIARTPGGDEVPQSLGVAADDLHLVTTSSFTLLVAAMENGDGGARLVGWKSGVGPWDGGWQPRFEVSNVNTLSGLSAAAANAQEALVIWSSPPGIRGFKYPSGSNIFITGLDAGVSALSAAGIDGGFVVSWVESSGRAHVTRLQGTAEPFQLLPGSGFALTQALTNDSAELVVSQSSTLNLHRYTGSWSTTSQGSPVGLALATSSPRVIFNVVPLGASTWHAGANLVSTFAGAPDTSLGTFASALALAGRSDIDQALLVFRGGPRDLQVRELAASPGLPFTTTPLVLGAAAQPFVAPANQRSPSVVWLDPKSQFLLAWEEDTPDAGTAVRLSLLDPAQIASTPQVLALPSPLGPAKPRLLRAPGGARHAVAVTRAGTTVIYPLQEVAGDFTIGAALTSPRLLPFAVLGDRIAMQWGAQSGLTASANLETMARIASADPAPRCVAVTRDKLWFVTDGMNGAFSVDDQPAGMASQTTALTWSGAGPLFAPCAQATSTTPPIIYLAGSDAGLVQVRSFLPSGPAPLPVTRVGELGSIADQLSVEPLIATLDGGALVTWASVRDGVQVGFATTTGVMLGPGFGGNDVTAVSIAASPAGQAVIAWDSFDTTLGVRRVQYRYLLPQNVVSVDAGSIDGGVLVDSGVVDSGIGTIDAGDLDSGVVTVDAGGSDSGISTIDAGLIDSGVPLSDSGVVDSGVASRDAGAVEVDSGVADGGVEVAFVHVCGCTESGSGGLPFFVLAMVMLAARRRTHV